MPEEPKLDPVVAKSIAQAKEELTAEADPKKGPKIEEAAAQEVFKELNLESIPVGADVKKILKQADALFLEKLEKYQKADNSPAGNKDRHINDAERKWLADAEKAAAPIRDGAKIMDGSKGYTTPVESPKKDR